MTLMIKAEFRTADMLVDVSPVTSRLPSTFTALLIYCAGRFLILKCTLVSGSEPMEMPAEKRWK